MSHFLQSWHTRKNYPEFNTLLDWMHDHKVVLHDVEILLVVKVIEDDWKMEKRGRSSFSRKADLTDTICCYMRISDND